MNCRVLALGAALWAAGSMPATAQEWRFSFTEDGTRSTVNMASVLNPGNALLPQAAWTHTGSANLSVDAGPLSLSTGALVQGDDRSRTVVRGSIRELALGFSVSEAVDILVGKKILKWGTGYAFTPTSVVEPVRSPSDPSDRLMLNDGRTCAVVTALFGKSSVTAVYLNDVQASGGRLDWAPHEGAVRLATFIEGIDLALVAHVREGEHPAAGLNTASVLNEHLELHGELFASTRSPSRYEPLPPPAGMPSTLPGFSRIPEDATRWKVLLGGQYTFDGGINVVLEYYHAGDGLSRGEWKRWMEFVTLQQRRLATPGPDAGWTRVNLLRSYALLNPRGSMRDYLFTRWTGGTHAWSGELIGLMNLADGSLVVLPSVAWAPSHVVTISVRWSGNFGGRESEFGCLFVRSALTLSAGLQL